MKTIGIICEYNPLHLGHKRQMLTIRERWGADAAIVCLMSGNFVQRGQPAIVDMGLRARAAVDCGADLVLELPVTAALSSAEGFAARGVTILSGFCDGLCFGAESGTAGSLMHTAQALLSPDFSPALRRELDSGKSFPAARQTALERMGSSGALLLSRPNDILGVEYCKAIIAQGSAMEPLPIPRAGDYHAADADPSEPSATAVRGLMQAGQDWAPFVPQEARAAFDGAALHSLAAGERAVLARLRSMTEAEFAALPHGSEGLWRKLMHESRRGAALEEILTAVKSKRYTRTRLDRMVMCAYLGLTAEDLAAVAPYTRVLAFSGRGARVLKKPGKRARFPTSESPWTAHSGQWSSGVTIFTACSPKAPSPAGAAAERRVYIKK